MAVYCSFGVHRVGAQPLLLVRDIHACEILADDAQVERIGPMGEVGSIFPMLSCGAIRVIFTVAGPNEYYDAGLGVDRWL